MWQTVALSIVLIVASATLILWHLRTWRAADHGGLGDREADFLRRQFRRRWQASGMIGLVGVLLLGDLWITDPLSALLYWCGVALMVAWTTLLALADWFASRVYYGHLTSASHAEHAVIKAEIERFRREADANEE